MMRTEAHCFIMLLFTSRNGINLSAHGADKLNGKMAQATNSYDAYPVSAF
jgi:hypothetical protein